MQRAVQAQDRDAIRTLMAARKKGSKKEVSKVRNPSAWQRHLYLLSKGVLLHGQPKARRQDPTVQPGIVASSNGQDDASNNPAGGQPAYSRVSAGATALLVGAAVWAGMTALQKWRTQVRGARVRLR
eukprot:COSAG02_NODE_14943_length_1221_cov_1.686275_2_plen_127_part_00